MSARGDGFGVDVTLTDAGDGTITVGIDDARDRALLFGIDDDYLVVLRPEGAALGRWDGSGWRSFPHRPLSPRVDDTGRLTFSLAAADLGTTSFGWWLASVEEMTNEETIHGR